jgi:sterol desaturase/sphingolipid hydroxylase (fatty acid hydroxylase superfamily)
VYCTLGYRASIVANRLMQSGMTKVSNLDGGIVKGANENLALVNSNGDQTLKAHPYNVANGVLLKAAYRAPLPLKPSFLNRDIKFLERLKVSFAMLIMLFLLCWETLLPAFNCHKTEQHTRLRHGTRNYSLGTFNSLVVTVLFIPTWWWAANLAETVHFGILNLFPSNQVSHLLFAVALLDLWTWYWHKLNHDLPVFWRFHRVHHSDPHLDVTSAARFHIGELILSSLVRIPVILLLGIQFGELVIYETVLFAVVQFQHANIQLPKRLDAALGSVIVTPRIHRIHHSRLKHQTDRNFSSLFTIWDRAFDSFTEPEDAGPILVGLKRFDSKEYQTLPGLMRTPLVKSDHHQSSDASSKVSPRKSEI